MNRTSDHLLSAAASDPALAQVCDEIIERLQAGDRVDMASLALEHPEYADQLQRLVPALGALVDLGASAVQNPSGFTSTPSTSDLAPKVLGDYRILREIGRGGMGVVYEAEQRSLNRRVALKVLPMAAALDTRQFQRFQLEAQAAACMHHNNIVPVFAVGTEGGVPFYAMQYIEGCSLAEVIHELRRAEGLESEAPIQDGGVGPQLADLSTTALARSLVSGQAVTGQVDKPTEGDVEAGCPLQPRAGGTPCAGSARRASEGPLPTARRPAQTPASTRTRDYCRNIARLGLQAAEALDHAHTRGILHRDIKPANLLLDAEGRLWVTDFGLAQIQGNHGLTLSGDILGTLRYMSPEQALAKRVVIDGRTDVYSLGVTLYEMLTLQPAFDGKDRAEILRKIESDEPTPLRKLNASVPQDLETIIQKALTKEPAERYATARELADDLRYYLEDRPIQARRPNLVDRATKWVRRHRASVAVASVLLILAIIGLATSTILIAREQRRTSAALEQADARFQFARKVVDEMYSQFAEKWLKQQPKLTHVQRDFLEKALAFYEQFAAESGDDPQARFEAARASRRVGAIYDALNLTERSKSAFCRAIEQLQSLYDRFPDSREYLSELADSSLDLGRLECNVGRTLEAEPILRSSEMMLDGLTKGDPSSRKHRARHANSLYLLGCISRWTSRNPDAEILLRRSMELTARLELEGRLEPEWRFLLYNCELEFGHLCASLGRIPEAEKAFLNSITKLETFVAEEPTDRNYREALARALHFLDKFLSETRPFDLEKRLELNRRCVALCLPLVREFPDIPNYWEDLLVYQRNLLFCLITAGRDEEAEQVAHCAVEQAEKVVHDHPGVPKYLNILVNFSRDLAELYIHSPAGDRLHKPARALELARRAVEQRPEDTWCRLILGQAQCRTGDWKGCTETLMKLMGEDPQGGGYQHWLFLAMARWHLGDKDQARSWFARVDQDWEGYEKRCEQRLKQGTFTSPHPPWIRKVRAEAAALIGVKLSEGAAKPKPYSEPSRSPR